MHNSAASDALILGLSVTMGVILIRIRAGQVEHRRIKAEIERGGGEVLKITPNTASRNGFWPRTPPLYDVCFRTAQGETVTATCRSGLGHGVEWTWSSPRAGEPGGPVEVVEPTICLACGASIAAGRVRCAVCGWTYAG
jgi:hypothetical protein